MILQPSNHCISQTAGSDTSYFLHDALGSVANLTSSAGATQWTYAYEPFGTTRTETSINGPSNFLKFTGEYLDPTGLYHLRARQYDPEAGRFLGPDPARQSVHGAAISTYGYAAAQPTVMIDPSGLTFVPSDAGTAFARFASSSVEAPTGVEATECVGFLAVLAPLCVRVGIRLLTWGARAVAAADGGAAATKLALSVFGRVLKNPKVLENVSGSKARAPLQKLADAAGWQFGPLASRRAGGYRVYRGPGKNEAIRFHPGGRVDPEHLEGAPYWRVVDEAGNISPRIPGKP